MNYFDLHCDTLYAIAHEGGNLINRQGHLDLSRASVYDSFGQVFALFCGYRPLNDDESAHRMFEKLMNTKREQLALCADRLVQCRTGEDIDRARREGKQMAVISVEGAELLRCEGDFETAVDEGVRIITLSWNFDSCFACGAASDQNKGLTERGRALVRRMEQADIIPDVSHLSVRGFWELAELTDRPIMATHSDSDAVNPHPRNLKDDQIRELVRRGGLIGLNFYVPFVTSRRRISVKGMFPHIDRMMELGAENALAIGADLDGCDAFPNEIKDVATVSRLAEEMKRHGYSDALIDRIFYGNAIEFLRRNL